MRIANADGRLVIVTGEAGHEIAYDVEKNSGGQFSADPQGIYDAWGAFRAWAEAGQFIDGTPVRPEALGSPAPAPRLAPQAMAGSPPLAPPRSQTAQFPQRAAPVPKAGGGRTRLPHMPWRFAAVRLLLAREFLNGRGKPVADIRNGAGRIYCRRGPLSTGPGLRRLPQPGTRPG